MSEKKTVNGNDKADQKPEKGDDKCQDQPADNGSDKAGQMIPKTRFDQVVGQRKEAVAALEEVADDLVEEIPEDKRELIPDLPPAEKIKWLRKATRAGLFGGGQTSNGPDSSRPGGKPLTDFENMNPHAMRAAGYGKK